MNDQEGRLTPARIGHILEGLALDGRHYADNEYDKARYRRILELARALEHVPQDAPLLSKVVPVTPKVGVDGAVIERDAILLIQRRDSQKWAMPGGAVEVGERPSEAVIREVQEETGILIQTDSLVGVFDNWMDRHVVSHHLYHVVIRGHKISGTINPQATEVLAVKWFNLADLPPRDLFQPGHYDRVLKALRGVIGTVD
ncbi:MAG: NUDIX hydrolase N-terminal domain-containing protein [Firmicutes bacterium]|nr:NUDIX hydrolase N-terminal domain-containing protein [Bacillota bacterium]